ncbi:MAG: hypothetical protein ACRDG4_13915 [Chloroflexota bacterium]
MATDLSTIADNLAGYLRARSGVSQVQVRLSAAARQGKKRLPVPRLFTKQGAAFEINFVYKNEPRTFRYYVDRHEDLRAAGELFRVHSNGELMVRVPDDYGRIVPNDIYYVNRIDVAPGMLAPRS